MDKYDKSFLLVYVVQYANSAIKFTMILALQALLKDYYEMEPGKSSIYTAAIMVPWQIKFIFGCLTDSITLCGSRKKGWMILLSIVLVIMTALAATVKFENPSIVVLLLMLGNAANAGMDVVVDALMVMQAKRDPKLGS